MLRTYNDNMFRETFEHEFTWLSGFLRNVRRYGRRIAVRDPQTGRQWDYRALNAEANRLAHALRADGVGKNDVVMAALMNCPEFAFSYIGPRKTGAILNPVNFNLAPGELALLMDHNRPKVFIYSAEIKETASQAVKLAKHPPLRIVMADAQSGETPPEGHISYEQYVSSQPESDPPADFPVHIYDEVIRLCTSGTTSLPKCVPLNDINDVLSAHDVIMHYPMSCTDVTMNMTPWFHRGGCHCGGPGPTFYVGASLVIARRFVPARCLRWVSEHGVTFLMGAPASLEMLARTQEKHPVDLSSLRGLVTMGSPLEKAACIRYLEILTPNIFNGYGTTETFWNSFLRPYDLPGGAGTVGGSCIDDEVRVVRLPGDGGRSEPDDTVPTDGETVGEIIIRSPAKSTFSYYNNPAEEEKKFYRGWMYTGDLGTWTEDLYVTVCGRKDDMIVCAAENIYPSQVEEIINGFEKVSDCMITSVSDRLRGESVAAYVVPKDESLTIDELVAFCQESPMLSYYKRPRYFRLVEELPRTATGKKQHFVMKQQAEKDLEAGLLTRA